MSRSHTPAPTVGSSDQVVAARAKRALQEAKQRVTDIRRRRAEKLTAAQAVVEHQARKIAVIDDHLAAIDLAGRVLDHGWDAWRPDPDRKAYRATPLPRGALSSGALRVLRLAKQPMHSHDIALAIFRAYGFPPPPPTMLGVVAGQITNNLRLAEDKHLVRADRSTKRNHLWSLVPLDELRVHLLNITKV